MYSDCRLKSFDKFSRANLEYLSIGNNKFRHNYDRDLQFFILWENGRNKERQILREVQSNFNILFCAEISWSEKRKLENFNRIYSQPIDSKIIQEKYNFIGMGSFLCIVYEDTSPKYEYIKSLSGEIFIGNVNAVKVKYKLRNLLGANLVHGSSDISEFFHHASLLFHKRNLNSIMNIVTWDGKIHHLEQDLAGADGWIDIQEFCSTLNLSSDWVFIANEEGVHRINWGENQSIDILCDNLLIYTTSANAIKLDGNLDVYQIKVKNKTVHLNIKFVGDNFQDPVWQHQILKRKLLLKNEEPVLRNDDYFFTLLFFTKVTTIKPAKDLVNLLSSIGKKIGLTIDAEEIIDDRKAAKIVNGFMFKQNYRYYRPDDKRLHLNKNFIRFLVSTYNRENKQKHKLIKFIVRKAPPSIKKFIPVKIRNFIIR